MSFTEHRYLRARVGTAAALWVALTLACACKVHVADPEGPERPVNVPAAALWVGGPDGGVFVLLRRKSIHEPIYFAQIFDESGANAYKGPLTLDPASAKAVDVKSVDEFLGWDGTRLLLTHDRSLMMLKEPH